MKMRVDITTTEREPLPVIDVATMPHSMMKAAGLTNSSGERNDQQGHQPVHFRLAKLLSRPRQESSRLSY
jgi:hypothetical protein